MSNVISVQTPVNLPLQRSNNPQPASRRQKLPKLRPRERIFVNDGFTCARGRVQMVNVVNERVCARSCHKEIAHRMCEPLRN